MARCMLGPQSLIDAAGMARRNLHARCGALVYRVEAGTASRASASAIAAGQSTGKGYNLSSKSWQTSCTTAPDKLLCRVLTSVAQWKGARLTPRTGNSGMARGLSGPLNMKAQTSLKRGLQAVRQPQSILIGWNHEHICSPAAAPRLCRIWMLMLARLGWGGSKPTYLGNEANMFACVQQRVLCPFGLCWASTGEHHQMLKENTTWIVPPAQQLLGTYFQTTCYANRNAIYA